MAKGEKNQPTGKPTSPGVEKCISEECKKNSARAGFCEDHFNWFKEGLLTAKGKKPSDFDKKFYDYQRRIQKRAA